MNDVGIHYIDMYKHVYRSVIFPLTYTDMYAFTRDVHTSYTDYVIVEKLKNSDLKSIYILLFSSLQKDMAIKLRNFFFNLGLLCLLKFLNLILNCNLTFKYRVVNKPLVSLVDCHHV